MSDQRYFEGHNGTSLSVTLYPDSKFLHLSGNDDHEAHTYIRLSLPEAANLAKILTEMGGHE